jgi:hypothetical protein
VSPVFWAFALAMEVACVKERAVQKDYLRRLNSLKKRLYSEFNWLSGRDLCEVMSQLGHYYYNKKKFILLGENRDLYNFLIKNGFNPFTVYRWLLLERVPENIKAQLKERKMSQKKALSKAFKQRQETAETISVGVQEMGLALIRVM